MSNDTAKRTNHANRLALTGEEYEQRMKQLRSLEDVNLFIKDLVGPTIQTMLEAEMTHHLGYEKHDNAGDRSGNARNGYSEKTLLTQHGGTRIRVPRDRNSTFEPQVVPRHSHKTASDIEEQIIALYASGMTTRDIHAHMEQIYGIDVSPSMVSMITDKVEPLIREWRERPLSSIYLICYLDGIHFKVRDNGKIVNKCAYTVLGLNLEGKKEILGIWIGEHEGAKFWMQVLTELKNRGVDDIIFCAIDGLTGFKDAIDAVFPQTQVQRCIVHMVRASMRFIPHKLRDKFCADLRAIYTAASEQAAYQALQDMKTRWPHYAIYLQAWEENWPELAPFFSFSEAVRKILYTTNGVESVHRQLRKITKTTSIFPHDEALMKLLWLGQRDISKRWNAPVPGWTEIISQFAIMYPDRIKFR